MESVAAEQIYAKITLLQLQKIPLKLPLCQRGKKFKGGF